MSFYRGVLRHCHSPKKMAFDNWRIGGGSDKMMYSLLPPHEVNAGGRTVTLGIL